jgi:hypothetical protein
MPAWLMMRSVWSVEKHYFSITLGRRCRPRRENP